MITPSQWIIRPALPSDIAFIYATWLRSYRKDSLIGANCGTDIYFQSYARIMDGLLASPKVEVLIAALKEDEDIIIGYLVAEPGVLHYVFVKDAFRKLGVARSLYEASFPDTNFTTHTHWTRTASPIIQTLKLDYNPFLLFKQGEDTYGPSETDKSYRPSP